MGFRSFCASLGAGLPEPPTIQPRDFLSEEVDEAVDDLMPWLDEIVTLWEVYARIGGFPQAVAGYLAKGDVDPAFSGDLWDVIHGDALRRENFSAAQSTRLLRRLARTLAGPVNMTALAEDIGVGSHSTASRRVKDLVDGYCAWPCHRQGDGGLPNLAAQKKVYFTDPLLARLPQLRDEQPPPETAKISEQQLGLTLALALVRGDAVRYGDFSTAMYARSATGKEVDFGGHGLGGVAFEAKYTDRSLGRESQTIRAMFGGGVLATRAKVDRLGDVRALPAGLIALLLGRRQVFEALA